MIVDTNVFIDILTEGGRVGSRAGAEMMDAVVLLSTASTWEIAIKTRLGRLTMPDGWEGLVRESGFVPLPILLEHSVQIDAVGDIGTADPFDRLLLTQAAVEGEEFYTLDRALLSAGLSFVVDAGA